MNIEQCCQWTWTKLIWNDRANRNLDNSQMKAILRTSILNWNAQKCREYSNIRQWGGRDNATQVNELHEQVETQRGMWPIGELSATAQFSSIEFSLDRLRIGRERAVGGRRLSDAEGRPQCVCRRDASGAATSPAAALCRRPRSSSRCHTRGRWLQRTRGVVAARASYFEQ